MNTTERILASMGARLESGIVDRFGDAAAEYRTLVDASAPLLVPLLSVAPLRLHGADRIEFLHGQVSNHVRGLPVGAVNRSLLLNHKGHALADMTVARRENDLYLAIDGGNGDPVEASLLRHIVFDQVEIENLAGTLITVSLQGFGSRAVLARVGEVPPEAGFVEQAIGGVRVLIHRLNRCGADGFDIHLLAAQLPDLFSTMIGAGAEAAGETALEFARVEAGLPTAASEAGAGVLPQEAGLDAAVSYRKGCYLGQEIMARIEARGGVRRGLFGVRLADRLESEARDLEHDGRVVGRLGRVVDHPTLGSVALAVVRHDVPDGAALAVGGVSASIETLPFVSQRVEPEGAPGSL